MNMFKFLYACRSRAYPRAHVRDVDQLQNVMQDAYMKHMQSQCGEAECEDMCVKC